MSKASLAILAASSLSAAVLVAAVPQAAPPATKPAAPATSREPRRPLPRKPRLRRCRRQPATAPAPKTTDGTWPREVVTSIGIATMYVPQVEAWDGVTLEFRAAVSLRGKSDAPPVYGVLWGKARTNVDKDARVVNLLDREFTKLVIPSAPDKQETWKQVLSKEVQPAVKTIALDRLAALLEVAAADKMAASVPVKNDPPKIVFSKQIAILAYVDGKPAYQPVKDTKLERVINTRVLLLKDKDEHFIKVFDGWLEAKALDASEWEVVKKADKDLEKALADAKASGQVDFLPGGNPNDAKTLPTLKSGKVPRIVVATRPTELIVTEGEPKWAAIAGDQARVRREHDRQRASATRATRSSTCSSRAASSARRRSTGRGSTWPPTRLPKDFAAIPDDSPKENVKAAVAGTPQAKEALIANSIPQTAEVKISRDEDRSAEVRRRAEVRADRGHLAPVRREHGDADHPGERPRSWYAVQDAVWFTAAVGGRPLGGRDLGADRDLHDPGQLAAALRHVRADLRDDARHRLRRLHAAATTARA